MSINREAYKAYLLLLVEDACDLSGTYFRSEKDKAIARLAKEFDQLLALIPDEPKEAE